MTQEIITITVEAVSYTHLEKTTVKWTFSQFLSVLYNFTYDILPYLVRYCKWFSGYFVFSPGFFWHL